MAKEMKVLTISDPSIFPSLAGGGSLQKLKLRCVVYVFAFCVNNARRLLGPPRTAEIAASRNDIFLR